MDRVWFVLILFTIFLPPALGASKTVGEWDRNEHVEMRLISGVKAVGERVTLPFGLQFRMKPGWKLYWRSPGDAGFPPRPVWDGSENIADVSVHWPAPTRFSIFNFETLGYTDQVILPLTVTLERAGNEATLRAKVDYLTCKDICIPYQGTAELPLRIGAALASPIAHELDRYQARVPGNGRLHGLTIIDAQLKYLGDRVEVTVVATADEPFDSPDIFIEGPEGTFFGKPKVQLSEGGHRATAVVPGSGFKIPTASESVPLTLTLVDGSRMLEQPRMTKPGEPSAHTSNDAPESQPIFVILLLALVGGFILNFMPCVLPVLSLKLLSVINQGGRDSRKVRSGFIASAAGIIFSFLLIAGSLIALKSAGIAIGWGIQFQQPLFIVTMTLVVVLFAGNLFNFFEIVLPSSIASLAGSVRRDHSLGGHFATGTFATLLATPCSAPFLGTAVGFALSRGPTEILGIFFVLGLGLSLPYLLVAVVPQLATRLPKPGNWMIWLRRFLGLALAATAIWLLMVLAAQIGADKAFGVGSITMLMVVVLALKRLPGSRLGCHAGKLTAILALTALVAGGSATTSETKTYRPSANWHVFDKDVLRQIVNSGKTVFVDVTADWGLTCQLNKNLVLDTEPVATWLEDDRVVAMRADWTRPNPIITAYLATFGRYGIPFNAVYGPDAPNGITLPELLTSNIIAEAAGRADTKATLKHR